MYKKNFFSKIRNVKKKINYIYKLIFVYFCFLIISISLFIGLFWIKIFDFFDILFFKSFLLLLITLCLISLFLFLLRKLNFFKIISKRDILIICLLSFIFNNFIYGLVPFNTSRSVSVMIVGYLYNNKDRNITYKELDEYIYKLYFLDEKAVLRRINEQIKIGNVEQVEDQYKLTEKGVVTVKFMDAVTEMFNTKKNYIRNLLK